MLQEANYGVPSKNRGQSIAVTFMCVVDKKNRVYMHI